MWDRPPEQWPRDEQGHVAGQLGPDLDLDDLQRELDRRPAARAAAISISTTCSASWTDDLQRELD
jgi:hypothetical protein